MKPLLVLVSATWLVACGQTGPLRLPEKTAPAQTPSATEAAEPTQTTPSP